MNARKEELRVCACVWEKKCKSKTNLRVEHSPNASYYDTQRMHDQNQSALEF